jgi:hypothetical protein
MYITCPYLSGGVMVAVANDGDAMPSQHADFVLFVVLFWRDMHPLYI